MADEKIPKLDSEKEQLVLEVANKLQVLIQQFANDFADLMLTAVPEGQHFHVLPFYTAFQFLLRDIETEVFVSLANKNPEIKKEIDNLCHEALALEQELISSMGETTRTVAGVTWYYYPTEKVWKKTPPPSSKDN